ncbi:MAG: hypothetical protein HY741_10225 [Chloroflexi bacterium]|nr:hypothetical protein [Chloroflexota bacterium]
MKTNQRPWQKGATELISHALLHLHKNSEFDQRIAFLLLDVGVETVFKTFLTLGEKIGGPKIDWEGGKKAVDKWDFPILCDAIARVASDQIHGIDLQDVRYFHSHRNKLYHEEDGITIRPSNVKEYASLAVELLKRLLDVDLSEELRAPEIEAKRVAEIEAKSMEEERAYQNRIQTLRDALEKIYRAATLAIERVYPPLALPSFQQSYNEVLEYAKEHSDLDSDSLPLDLQKKLEKTYTVIPKRFRRHIGELSTPEDFYLNILNEIGVFHGYHSRDQIQSAKEFLTRVENNEPIVMVQIEEEYDTLPNEFPIRDYIQPQAEKWTAALNAMRQIIEWWTNQRDLAETTVLDEIESAADPSQTNEGKDWREFWGSIKKFRISDDAALNMF